MRNAAQIAAAFAAIAAAAACASQPEPAPPPIEQPAPPPAPAAPPPPVQRNVGPVPGSIEDFQRTVGDRVYFDYDRYDLTPDARATLEKQAAWLQRYPSVRLRLAGNCDERGTREYNLALGARRANAAKEYLTSLGVSSDRIETVSYGKERPIDPRSTEEAWSRNRNSHSEIVSGAVAS